MKKTKHGFTLAEVLVTLTIIGVIASLTIPLLIGGTGSAELTTAFKKSVSVLNQAMLMGQAKTGTDASTCANCNSATGAIALAKFFGDNLNIINGATTAVITTADGMVFTFLKPVSTDPCDVAVATLANNKCYVTVDVNGPKGAGTLNSSTTTFTDVFALVITPTTVVPFGPSEKAALAK